MDGETRMFVSTDLETCAEIYTGAFTSPPLEYHWITRAKAGRYINDLMRAPGFIGFTYLVGGEIVAFCLGSLDNYFDGSVYEVKEFAVKPDLHRSGVGSAFLKDIERKLAGYDVPAISLNTSRNLPAFGFYLRNGYEEIKENISLMKWIKD